VGAKNGTNMLYITARSYGVLCNGNGWASNTRDCSMARSLGTKYPPFATWLLNIVRVQAINGMDVDANVIHFSSLPNPITYMYKNRWAYGNHY
jgi:hypothetical protein